MGFGPAFGGLVLTAAPAMQSVAGYSQTLIFGLLAVLVLPAITILFVGHLVGQQTIDEERIRRLEAEVADLRDELGVADDETRSD